MTRTLGVIQRIRDIDSRLLVAGERLRRYRNSGQDVSCVVQMGVIDRTLDERLELMKERDRG